MGLYLWSYAVDLEKLGAVFGSRRRALANKVIAQADVEDNASWFEDAIAEGAPRLDQAITEIIDGKITKKQNAFQYVYATKELCRVLGTVVGDELKAGEWIEKVLDPLLKKVRAKDFHKLMHLNTLKLPLPIPKPKDVPWVTTLQPAEVATMLGALARVEARATTEKLRADHREALDFVLPELTGRLRGASKRRRGLVTFLY
jgi:hypothetical protein